MARVIIFSRYFPSHHFRKGEPTNFVEKFWTSIKVPIPCSKDSDKLQEEMSSLLSEGFISKHHTIRGGNRWKVGDMFSPRVWSDAPYKSKQIIIAEDIEIKKIWNIEIFMSLGCVHIGIREDETTHNLLSFGEVAKNDGLTFEELQSWFDVKPDKPFVGQIICWNENVEY